MDISQTRKQSHAFDRQLDKQAVLDPFSIQRNTTQPHYNKVSI